MTRALPPALACFRRLPYPP